MRTALRATTVAALVLAPLAVPAAASAAASTDIYDCGALGGVAITTHGNNSSEHGGWGVGQTPDGHLIPVSFTFSALDLTTGTTLFSGGSDKGGGNANHNQPTITCSQDMTGPLAGFLEPGDQLPPGTQPTDTVRVRFAVAAVQK
ncbi:MAG: hypothetical protein ACTHQ3_03000 [Motilibacteraceae bacterium]